MERTFVAIKPDAVQRNLIGEIVQRFEKKGIKIIGLKLMNVSVELASKHYAEHKGKPFYDSLIQFITSGPVVALVLEGDNIISVARNMMGATNPQNAAPGTIRADYAQVMDKNVIHGSDGPESAKREISLFFNESELVAR
jgi:nucleoside-diphosphate kinase